MKGWGRVTRFDWQFSRTGVGAEYQVEQRVQHIVGGIPMHQEVYRMVERRRLVARFRLVTER